MKHIRRIFIILVVIFNLYYWFFLPKILSSLIFVEDYENGSVSIEWDLWGIGSKHGLKIVGPPKRAGKYAARFQINYSDQNRYNGKRAEIVRWHYNVGKILGPDEWYGFSIYLPKDYVPSDEMGMVFQWHAFRDKNEDPRDPPLCLLTEKGKWFLRAVYSENPEAKITKKMHKIDLAEIPVKREVWTDWVVHVKWDYRETENGGKGFVQAWQRFKGSKWKKVVEYKGPNCYNDEWNIRFQWGIKMPYWSDCDPGEKLEDCSDVSFAKRVVYNDELRVAKSGPYLTRFMLVAPDTFKISKEKIKKGILPFEETIKYINKRLELQAEDNE